MLDIKTLLPELKKLVTDLSEDLLARSTAKDDSYSSEVDSGLREAYTQIEKGGRTAQAFEVWREDYLDQVAVAWVLGCVFVRFMEDNHLIDECWLAGEGDRRKLAEDTHELYFREHPHESDREYFEHIFHEVGRIPACRDLFAEGKTPLWAVGPSGDMAMKLLAFWREIDADTGHLARSFEVEDGDTRFLGDLYQDLSERARDKYALLQTPVFVEEFILDRTLDPAIDEFGLDKVRMIDPTCGSGHFLLGGFARLFDLWIKREDNEVVAAQRSLDGVWGCDINPFAVAIARFRLIVAAIRACSIERINDAPAWTTHLATGDSLLFGSRWDRDGTKRPEVRFLDDSWAPEIYACEDKEAISVVLGQQYHAVVGNPPYITPKDSASRKEYRDRYLTAHDKYHLSTPFTERFFELARTPCDGSSGGYVGLIKDNAFMKRDFGKKLIQDFLPTVDLTHVIDSSGVYLPGHGTPTTILFGRNRKPMLQTIRAIRGIQGEPATPEDASKGLVWLSILKHIDESEAEDTFVSSTDVARGTFSVHPWSLAGGGAAELKQQLDESIEGRLSNFAESIGITCFTLEDDVYIIPEHFAGRLRIDDRHLRPMVEGDRLRDWCGSECDIAVFPFDELFRPIGEDLELPEFKYLWGYRTNLSNSKMFGSKTKVQSGLKWYEYGRLTHTKLQTPLSIAFGFVATHNHFVLDRGGKVFKQSAPIIKLRGEFKERDHQGILGLLNSSVACFWMKQVFFPKGGDHVGQEGARVRRTWWDERYEFAATQMQNVPVPSVLPFELSQQLDRLGLRLVTLLPSALMKASDPVTANQLDECREQTRTILDQARPEVRPR